MKLYTVIYTVNIGNNMIIVDNKRISVKKNESIYQVIDRLKIENVWLVYEGWLNEIGI